jgi:hypothetical protein
VADVWRVRVKTKRLAEVLHAALLPPPVKEKREVDAATDSPPAKKMKATKALEDMSIDELQDVYKAKLDKNQVRGPSARNKAWLIDQINGGLTVRAKRAQGKQGGGGGKRARTAK